MDEARRVLERLDRIEGLDRARVPAEALLTELRALLVEAEAWAKREGDSREAVDSFRAAMDELEGPTSRGASRVTT